MPSGFHHITLNVTDLERVGLDHIALGATRAEVEELTRTLQAAGVDADLHLDRAGHNAMVTFRDPDNFQWEFFEET